MSTPLDTVVSVDVNAATQVPSVTGFGKGMIPSGSTSATWTTEELTREYADATEVLSDFTSSTPEYKASVAYFSQEDVPESVVIGRLTDPPVMKADVAAVTAVASTDYKFLLGGSTPAGVLIPTTEIAYTSGGTTSISAIATGLAAAVTTASLTGISASNVSDACRIVGTAGTWLWVKLMSSGGVKYGPEKGGLNLLSLAMVGSEPSTDMATQLTAIDAENSTWIGICGNPYQSLDIEKGIAAWAETEGKLYDQSVCDTDASTTVLSGATDIGAYEKGLSRKNSSFRYHEYPDQFIDAAFMGAWLPITPGSDDAKFITLDGITPSNLTTTQRTNLDNKNYNHYTTIAGVSITAEGKAAGGQFIPITRGIMFAIARIQEGVYGLLINANKTPLINTGIAKVGAKLRSVVDGLTADIEGNGVFDNDPAPTVTVPKKAALSSSDVAAGILSGTKIAGVMSVGIHKVEVELNLSF